MDHAAADLDQYCGGVSWHAILVDWKYSAGHCLEFGLDGGGDVKLWIGLLWCTFLLVGEPFTLIVFLTLIVTSLVQIIARILMKEKAVGIKMPGAWRTVVFILLVALHSSGGFHNFQF